MTTVQSEREIPALSWAGNLDPVKILHAYDTPCCLKAIDVLDYLVPRTAMGKVRTLADVTPMNSFVLLARWPSRTALEPFPAALEAAQLEQEKSAAMMAERR